MESSAESYNISFFKPTTPRARHNRNMVIWLVSIWFIAIFGFQILLKVLEKPVPQPAYLSFQESWSTILAGSYTDQDLREFGKSCLSVLGKIDVSPEAKTSLDDALSWAVYQLAPADERQDLVNQILDFQTVSASITTLDDKKYTDLKSALSVRTSAILGLSEYDVRRNIIPFELQHEGIANLDEETKVSLPGVMEKYLVHNQSVLTDTRFIGFPFHNFYTAVFLLILFVGLCWIYCVRIDTMNKKLEIAE
jgi:putative solute:sodium symporter small subunit